ncbi:MAG: hypothetical protein P4M11_15565 [Candidatus Pacebacteria bacterium]|nr:hypothetical protein [Candidatus Paceibacterota bacterium]
MGRTDEMRDAQTIFIYKALKKCNSNLQVTVELIESSNIGYLLPKSQVKDYEHFDLSPIFASGEVYISTVIDTLSCQAYYNPHIIAIIHQILTGGSLSGDQQAHQSNLWQIVVPEEYVVLF